MERLYQPIKKYKTTINGHTVYLTHVSCNGKTVWKYVPQAPVYTGGGTTHQTQQTHTTQTATGGRHIAGQGSVQHIVQLQAGTAYHARSDDEPYENEEINIDDIILKDNIEDVIDPETPEIE